MWKDISSARAKISALSRCSLPAFPPRRRSEAAIAIALVVGYVALLAYFDFVDFYHRDFFVSGPQLIGYQVARLIFIPYLAWTIYFVGALVCGSVTTRQPVGGLPPLGSAIRCISLPARAPGISSCSA